MTFSVSADFGSIVDGLEAVVLTQRDGSVYSTDHALIRAIDNSDPQSGGDVIQADTVWHLPQEDISDMPDLGCGLVRQSDQDDDVVWTVLSVASETFDSRWRCICRRYSLREVLGTTVTIQVASYAKSSDGDAVATWSDETADVRCKIQPVGHDYLLVNELLIESSSHFGLFNKDQTLGPQRRLKDSDGVVYRIDRVDQESALGMLQIAYLTQTVFTDAA